MASRTPRPPAAGTALASPLPHPEHRPCRCCRTVMPSSSPCPLLILGAAPIPCRTPSRPIHRKDYPTAAAACSSRWPARQRRAPRLRLGLLLLPRPRRARERRRRRVQWFERAARQGLAEAQFQLGNMYAYGLADRAADARSEPPGRAVVLRGRAPGPRRGAVQPGHPVPHRQRRGADQRTRRASGSTRRARRAMPTPQPTCRRPASAERKRPTGARLTAASCRSPRRAPCPAPRRWRGRSG
ncbi:MAG: hypothetical protein MZV63_26875 [Marinilabiliales bacterium]|nr:hypothetical protein [Marinilabiliales bacterium]